MITINDILMLTVTIYCGYNVYSVKKPNIEQERFVMCIIYTGMIILGFFVPEYSILIFLLVIFPDLVKGIFLTYVSIIQEWESLYC